MVDPIGTPASILTLVVFAFDSTVTLYQALQDFQDYPDEVVELRAELNDLQKVFGFLRNAASQNADDLLELGPLLSRCGEACKDFLKLVNECSPERKGRRAMIVGWTKLQFAKKDVWKLKDLLSRVKSTTSLALGGLNLRRFAVTAAAIDEYQCLITKIMAETQQNLREINSRLDSLSKKHPKTDDQDIQEWENLQADKARCENDLEALSGVLDLLQKVELDKLDNLLTNPNTDQVVRTTLPRPTEERLTATDVREFMEKIPKAISDLKWHLSSLEDKMRPLSQNEMKARQMLRDEKQADEQCLTLLGQLRDQADQKRSNVFKDVRAAKSAHQVIISTVGDLINCENVRAEAEAKQWMGQMSDESIQHLCGKEYAKSSTDLRFDQRSVLPDRKWIACCFLTVFANLGFVMWIVDRGGT